MTRILRAKAFDALRYRIDFLASRLKWRLMGLKMGHSVEIYGKVVIHDVSRVSIGDNTTIGAFTVLFGSGTITIGHDVLISTNCSLFSITHRTDALAQGRLYRNTRQMAPITIGNNVWIGTGCRILPGVTIGDNSIVGAGSVVTRSVPAGVVVIGVPAKIVRRLEESPQGA